MIPNGCTYTLVQDKNVLLSRRMERRVIGKTRHVNTSIAGTEEEGYLVRSGITLHRRVNSVVVDNYDRIGKYSVTIYLHNGKD